MIPWAAQNAVVTLILAIAVAVVCRIGRLDPASRHALWLVVLVKLVTPPIVAWPWALPILSSAAEKVTSIHDTPVRVARQDQSTRDRRASTTSRGDYVVSSEVITLDSTPADSRSPELEAVATVTKSPGLVTSPASLHGHVGWVWCVRVVWITGALAMVGVHLVRIFRMQRRVVRATAAPEWLVREVADAAAGLRTRPPRVMLASGIPSPLVWSFGRATLLWPRGLAEGTQAGCWRGVIVHELAHVRRRDHWTSWLELVAGCVWWFNPVVWYARSQLRENAELACDAWVVRTLPDGRRSYAEALLSVCEFDTQPAPLPALGVQSGARRAFERRLTMILRERFPVRVSRGAWIAAALLAAVAAPNWYLIAGAQDVVEDAEPLPIDPTTPEPVALEDGLFDEPSPDLGLIPLEAELRVQVPDGGEVLIESPPSIDPLPSQSAPPEADIPPVGPTPIPSLPHAESRSEFGRGGFGSRESGGSSRFGGGNTRGPAPVAGGRPSRSQQQTHVVESDSFTLTRTTYRVPENVAENLSRFLEQNLSWPHLMDVEVAPGTLEEEGRQAAKLLVVTASPDAQEVVGNLIGLMLESKLQRPETSVRALSEPTRTRTLPSAPSRFPSQPNPTDPSETPVPIQ